MDLFNFLCYIPYILSSVCGLYSYKNVTKNAFTVAVSVIKYGSRREDALPCEFIYK
jgi:hypothetical protein